MFELTPTSPHSTFGQLFMWLVNIITSYYFLEVMQLSHSAVWAHRSPPCEQVDADRWTRPRNVYPRPARVLSMLKTLAVRGWTAVDGKSTVWGRYKDDEPVACTFVGRQWMSARSVMVCEQFGRWDFRLILHRVFYSRRGGAVQATRQSVTAP